MSASRGHRAAVLTCRVLTRIEFNTVRLTSPAGPPTLTAPVGGAAPAFAVPGALPVLPGRCSPDPPDDAAAAPLLLKDAGCLPRATADGAGCPPSTDLAVVENAPGCPPMAARLGPAVAAEADDEDADDEGAGAVVAPEALPARRGSPGWALMISRVCSDLCTRPRPRCAGAARRHFPVAEAPKLGLTASSWVPLALHFQRTDQRRTCQSELSR